MRVLHVLRELRPSGAELMYHAAADLWRAQGLQVEILSTGTPEGGMAGELERVGYRIHYLPFTSSPSHVIGFYRFLRKTHFDVVHLNTERGNFWYGFAARCAGVHRIFRTVHNIFPFTGVLRVRRRMQRLILQHLGVRTISISESVKLVELEKFSNRTELIPNWFDSRKYRLRTEAQRLSARRQFGLEENAFVICTVAGCWPYKNHEAIIDALSSIPVDIPVVYLHAGLEPANHPERERARELKVAQRIQFLGAVPDVLPVLHASDVFLMPSHYEGFGCAALEAMGTGLPVVLSLVSGLRDFKNACPRICWVNTSPHSIAEALIKLWNTPSQERTHIGEQLSSAAHGNYALGVGAQRYGELYLGQSQDKTSQSPPSEGLQRG